MDLAPNAKELRALRLFISQDETRIHLATLWQYASDGGLTYVATDGHTIVVRRSGTHRTMVLADIAKLVPLAVNLDGAGCPTTVVPPGWPGVCRAGTAGKLALSYGVNVAYMARVGDVERAAGAREADDYVPDRNLSAKTAKRERADLKDSTFAEWIVPSDARDGWFWAFETKAARWEGVVMPRRVR